MGYGGCLPVNRLSVLNLLQQSHIIPQADQSLSHSKSKIKTAFDGNQHNLIQFRNEYAHGATPSDEHCLKDLDLYGTHVDELIAQAKDLASVDLLWVNAQGEVFLARGPSLSPIPHESLGLVHEHCYLRNQSGLLIDIHPLLIYREDVSEASPVQSQAESPVQSQSESQEDVKGKFYFYNDLRGQYATLLNYTRAEHLKDSFIRDFFLERFPIDEWRKLGRQSHLDMFRERVEELLEVLST